MSEERLPGAGAEAKWTTEHTEELQDRVDKCASSARVAFGAAHLAGQTREADLLWTAMNLLNEVDEILAYVLGEPSEVGRRAEHVKNLEKRAKRGA